MDGGTKNLVTWSGDGLDPSHPLSIKRSSKCEEILQQALGAGAVLVRAPPSSGKTSFATVIGEHATDLHVYSLTLLNWDTAQYPTMESWFGVKCNGSLRSILLANQSRDSGGNLVLIDELQIAYKLPNDPFWEQLKELMQRPVGKRATRVICFGAYGESLTGGLYPTAATPVQFNVTFGLSLLRFTEEEWKEVCDQYGSHSLNPIHESARETLYRMTGGHPSLLLEALRHIYKSTKIKVRPRKIMEVVMSGGMLAVWKSNRSLTRVLPALKDEQKHFIRTILNLRPCEIQATALSTSDQSTFDTLVRDGLLCDNGSGTYGFAAPIVETVLIGMLLAGEFKTPPTTFRNFVKGLLPCFSKRQLNDLNNGGLDGRVFERAFQMEFFRCAYAALGSNVGICHADVGRTFGAPGALDFYVNSNLQWAIELVRESDRLNEHLSRFSPTGKYKDIPIKEFVLLNFVNKPQMADPGRRIRCSKPKDQNEIRVYYARDCPFLKVCTSDCKTPDSIILVSS